MTVCRNFENEEASFCRFIHTLVYTYDAHKHKEIILHFSEEIVYSTFNVQIFYIESENKRVVQHDRTLWRLTVCVASANGLAPDSNTLETVTD